MNKAMKKIATSLNSLMIPLVALFLLLLFNLFRDINFFRITVDANGILSGNLISIINSASELAIIGMGMTLVTASCGGQDISVGTVSAIAGAMFAKMLLKTFTVITIPTILVSVLVAILVTILFKLFNGVLVAVFRIQPMIATLILYSCGRSIASWIIVDATTKIEDPLVRYIGMTIPGSPIPTPIYITIVMGLLLLLIFKLTNLSLYTQAVGINQGAARLNGINPVVVKLLCFVVLGICVTLASVIQVGRIGSLTQNTILADIEMDAILAVAIGGNSLGGGKFRISGTVLGAYVIETLMTTLRVMNVDTSSIKTYKALAIIAVVVAGSPVIKAGATNLWKKIRTLAHIGTPKEVIR